MTDYEKYLFDELINEYAKDNLTEDDFGELFSRFNNLSHLTEVKPYLLTMRFLGRGTPCEEQDVLGELQPIRLEDSPILYGLYNDLLLFGDESNASASSGLAQAANNGYSDCYLKNLSHLHHRQSSHASENRQGNSPKVKQDNTQILNMVRMGVMYLGAGDRNKAIMQFESALRRDSNCLGAQLGIICAIQNDNDVAFRQKLLSYKPEMITDWLNQNPELIQTSLPNPLLDCVIIKLKSAELTRAVLEAGADPNGDSALHFALFINTAITEKRKIVHLLLENGADPNKELVKNDRRVTPLIESISMLRDTDIAKDLLEHGANVNYLAWIKGSSANALHAAIWEGMHSIVKVLLDKGADPNLQFQINNQPVTTALSTAVMDKADLETTKLLFQYGADINFTTQANQSNEEPIMVSILMEATESGNAEIVRFLIENGADVVNDAEVLPHAIQRNISFDIVKLLIDNGANVNYADKYENSAISDALFFYKSETVSLIKKLLEAGANPKVKFIMGPSPASAHEVKAYHIPVIDMAIEMQEYDVVDLLMQYGASFDDTITVYKNNGRIVEFPVKKRTYSGKIDTKRLTKYGWKGGGFFQNTMLYYDCTPAVGP